MVTVIIPTYKRYTMIGRAITSILNQTYKNIEIIVVDDNGKGSEDQIKTYNEIKKYEDSIKYFIHDMNRGGSAARNTGWRMSHGDYITFLDDDDEIDVRKIEKQVSCLDSLDDEWGACYTSYHILMPGGSVLESSNCKSGDVYLYALSRNMYLGSGSNLLLKKSLVDDIDGYDERFLRNQDIEFLVRVSEKCKIAFVEEDLLTIHFEVRQFKRSFEFSDNVSKFYLSVFDSRIQSLNEVDRKKVRNVISLDRARQATNYKEYRAALNILKDNNVGFGVLTKYCIYLFKRYITKKSYGFYY